tara:strand:+ start:515 stop:805 length:291 start_codon:yes stop_codon:yes gene_type:complete
MQKNQKCNHSIEWDDDSLHRPNPDTHDILMIMGKCKYCDWDFKKQYIVSFEVILDYDLNVGMPYDLSIYDQVMKNIHVYPYTPIIHFYDLKKGTLK